MKCIRCGRELKKPHWIKIATREEALPVQDDPSVMGPLGPVCIKKTIQLNLSGGSASWTTVKLPESLEK